MLNIFHMVIIVVSQKLTVLSKFEEINENGYLKHHIILAAQNRKKNRKNAKKLKNLYSSSFCSRCGRNMPTI